VSDTIPSFTRSLSDVLSRCKSAVVGVSAPPDTDIPLQPQSVKVRVVSSSSCPESVLSALEKPLHQTAEKIYRALHAVALGVLQARSQALTVNQVVIHQSVEVLAVYLGMSRVTFYKHLKALHRAGLIASKGHVSNYGNLSRQDGTLFAVSLKPEHQARLRYDDLKHKYRDLQADIHSGCRTAWSFLQSLKQGSQSRTQERQVSMGNLVSWALTPGLLEQKPVMTDCEGRTTEYVYSLQVLSETHPSKRAEMVDAYAHALAQGFLDSSNINFWRKILWQAIKCDFRGTSALSRLSNALVRLTADIEEWKDLRSPGALLVSRLKDAGIWDELVCPG
jgi:DNA-binding transcriptional ArsR family regulator